MSAVRLPVILLKSEGDSNSDWEETFKEYDVHFISPVYFEAQNSFEVKSRLQSTPYDGLIFTSPRSVEIVGGLIDLGEVDAEVFKPMTFFVVGPITEKELRRRIPGVENIVCSASNLCLGAKGLASIIDDWAQESFPSDTVPRVLFLHGDLSLNDLPHALSSTGKVGLDRIVCYKTRIPHPLLEEKLQSLLSQYFEKKQRVAIVFFSPSGVDASRVTLQSAASRYPHLLRCIAFGPTTARALVQADLDVCGICGASRESVLKVIQTVEQT